MAQRRWRLPALARRLPDSALCPGHMDAMVLQVRRSLAFLVERYSGIRWATCSSWGPFCPTTTAAGRPSGQTVPTSLPGWFGAWGWPWQQQEGDERAMPCDKGFDASVQGLGNACGHAPLSPCKVFVGQWTGKRVRAAVFGLWHLRLCHLLRTEQGVPRQQAPCRLFPRWLMAPSLQRHLPVWTLGRGPLGSHGVVHGLDRIWSGTRYQR